MNIDRIPDVRPDTPEAQVTVKQCGNVIEVRYMRSVPAAIVEKVSAELYVDKRTGEVKEFRHAENRADSKALSLIHIYFHANKQKPSTEVP